MKGLVMDFKLQHCFHKLPWEQVYSWFWCAATDCSWSSYAALW